MKFIIVPKRRKGFKEGFLSILFSLRLSRSPNLWDGCVYLSEEEKKRLVSRTLSKNIMKMGTSAQTIPQLAGAPWKPMCKSIPVKTTGVQREKGSNPLKYSIIIFFAVHNKWNLFWAKRLSFRPRNYTGVSRRRIDRNTFSLWELLWNTAIWWALLCAAFDSISGVIHIYIHIITKIPFPFIQYHTLPRTIPRWGWAVQKGAVAPF